MRLNRTDDETAGVSMSPLIDCVFLLLIFFLVSTMLKKENKDISIELPDSSSSVKLLPDDDVLVIGVDDDGAFYYEGRPSSAGELQQYLREVAAGEPDKRVRVDVDKAAPWHRAVEVLNALQFRGLENVGIRTYDENYNRRP